MKAYKLFIFFVFILASLTSFIAAPNLGTLVVVIVAGTYMVCRFMSVPPKVR